VARDEPITKPTATSVADFLAAVPDARRREEALVLDALHRRVTGCEPRMWGPSIVGYGSYDYTYESGRSGTSCRGGFSPRKAKAVVYLTGDFGGRRTEADALFDRLGKHKTGKSCLYINRLADIDQTALEALVALSWECMNANYPL
jgi:Domain of unknown function (DU1801)